MDQLLAIKAFARVVESGSFTRAADSLNMPKATLSKHLVYPQNRHVTHRVRVFIDWLADCFPAQVAGER